MLPGNTSAGQVAGHLGSTTVFMLCLTQEGEEERKRCHRPPDSFTLLTSDLICVPRSLLFRGRGHLTLRKRKKAKSYLSGGHCFCWISPLGSTLKNQERWFCPELSTPAGATWLLVKISASVLSVSYGPRSGS